MAKEVKTKEARHERRVCCKRCWPPFGIERLIDGDRRKGENSDPEGQRSRVVAGERKMSSVASAPFFRAGAPSRHTLTSKQSWAAYTLLHPEFYLDCLCKCQPVMHNFVMNWCYVNKLVVLIPLCTVIMIMLIVL